MSEEINVRSIPAGVFAMSDKERGAAKCAKVEQKTALMIDLETLGTTSDAVVTEIGCCVFDERTGVISAEFSRVCDVGWQVANGRKICPNTLAWYQAKGLTISGLSGDDRVGLSAALIDMREWFRYLLGDRIGDSVMVWMRGGMDQSILDHAYGCMGEETPWPHWHVRDVRTAMAEVGMSKADVHGASYEPAHGALADCKDQVKQLCAVRRRQVAQDRFAQQGRKLVDSVLSGDVKSSASSSVNCQESLVWHDEAWQRLKSQVVICGQESVDESTRSIKASGMAAAYEAVLAMMDREEQSHG